MDNLPANRDQLPAVSKPVPQVDNVLMEFFEAGHNTELLDEILMQLKTFTQIVDIASTNNSVTVDFTYPVIDEIYDTNTGARIPNRPHRDSNRPYFHLSPRITLIVRDRHQGVDLRKLLIESTLPPNRPIPMDHSAVAHHSYNDTFEIEFDINMFAQYNYTERWVKLLLVLFNATPEMKDKVEYVAQRNVKVKTPLEDALWKVCRALARFYTWQMSNTTGWRRDPFGPGGKQGAQGPQGAISYEPRLGEF
jgi:hypothetical protein